MLDNPVIRIDPTGMWSIVNGKQLKIGDSYYTLTDTSRLSSGYVWIRELIGAINAANASAATANVVYKDGIVYGNIRGKSFEIDLNSLAKNPYNSSIRTGSIKSTYGYFSVLSCATNNRTYIKPNELLACLGITTLYTSISDYKNLYGEMLLYRYPSNGTDDTDLDPDMGCADRTKEQISKLNVWLTQKDVERSEDKNKELMLNLLKKQSSGDLVSVAEEFYNHFCSGEGTPYSNDTLKKEFQNHKATETFVKSVNKIISDYIESGQSLDGIEYNSTNRNASVLVKKMSVTGEEIFLPSFTNNTGLGILIHGLAGAEISLTKYQQNGNTYTASVKYRFWDNFGLDDDDFSLGPRLYGGEGFDAWYILQHYDEYDGKYKPFRTEVTFTETLSGTVA